MDWAEFAAQLLPQPHTVTIQAYEGTGSIGPVYAAGVTVTPCIVEDTRRTVRVQTQDAAGREAVSSTTVYVPPATTAPPGSLVTLPSGRTAEVLAASTLDAAGWDLPEHLELALE